MRSARPAAWVGVLLPAALLAVLAAHPILMERGLRTLFPDEREVLYPRASLLRLVGEHLALVVVSGSLAVATGIALGVFVTRPGGRDFRATVDNLSALSQTIPPVAVLALAVPLLGFGLEPTVAALFLYSLLPVVRNTTAGIEAVPRDIREAAVGMGMGRGQILRLIELPLALPVIMAGVRTAVVINIGTATIGAVVGAGGLGAPIVSGLVRDNPAFVTEGAVAAALLAFLADRLLAQVEDLLSARTESPTATDLRPPADRRAGRG